ncbi:MAG: hypothetical protein SFU91_07215 [Chloroherpetonaceae bacterium]|nr:hypothetical protein [Chloroherpetonaceae bacterium]
MKEFKEENVGIRNFEGITGLWAFNEAGLGGVLHAFKIPFTGLWLSATSVLVLSLISYFSKLKSELISPSMVVFGVKLAVNPHASLGAYLALGFQSVSAYILKAIGKNHAIRTFVLSLLAHWFSALQRLITLTILFGEPFWNAVDLFAENILKQFGIFNTQFSKLMISIYFSIYSMSAILVAIYAARLPLLILKRVKKGSPQPVKSVNDSHHHLSEILPKKKKGLKGLFLLSALTLTVIPVLILGDNESALFIVIRAISILLIWKFVISPIGVLLVSRWIKRDSIDIDKKIKKAIASFPEQMSNIISSQKKYNTANPILWLHEVLIDTLTSSLFSEKK